MKLLPRYVLMIRPVHVSERVLLFAAVLLTLLVTCAGTARTACRGISHVVHRDTVYYEVACPRGVPIPFDTL